MAEWLSALMLIACSPAVAPRKSDTRQADCGALARTWFQARHPEGFTQETVDPSSVAIRTVEDTYAAHFNKALGRCFILVTRQQTSSYPDRPADGFISLTLIDLTEDRTLGLLVNSWPEASATPLDCRMDEAACTSQQQWHGLAARYLQR